MKLRVFSRQSEPGFRLSVVDLAVLAGALFLAWLAYGRGDWAVLAPLPIHLVATFFMFCNVIRIKTRFEIIWMMTYAVAVILALLLDLPLWPTVLTTTTASFLAVVGHALLSGQHRGVFYRHRC